MAPLKILLVDDHDDVRNTFADLLELNLNSPSEIVHAINGHEALKLLRSDDFDVLITDEMMPGMQGHELIQALEKEKADSMGIYLITAMSELKMLKLQLPNIRIMSKTDIFEHLIPELNSTYTDSQ